MQNPISRVGQIARRLLTSLTPPAASGTRGRYDRLIDAANRLPRPVLVYGTLALFALAIIDPTTFDRVMTSLRQMPEELWWLAAAIFAGHFGAREAHHLRERPKPRPETPPAQGTQSPS